MLGTTTDFRFALFILLTLLVIFWQGAGGFSLDRWVRDDAGGESSQAPASS